MTIFYTLNLTPFKIKEKTLKKAEAKFQKHVKEYCLWAEIEVSKSIRSDETDAYYVNEKTSFIRKAKAGTLFIPMFERGVNRSLTKQQVMEEIKTNSTDEWYVGNTLSINDKPKIIKTSDFNKSVEPIK